ncbi:MAG TPA: DUF4189 domain-containing protein [Devosiaceae bacterium]|jgi:hypothetical protein|nr:DUF4189 domain-containing protein [Devosiaceae bacterium]
MGRLLAGAIVAGAFAMTATSAAAAIFECQVRGDMLAVVIDPADPANAPVLGLRNGAADPRDIKFVLGEVPAASGFHYGNDIADFFGKGAEATLDIDGAHYPCLLASQGVPGQVTTGSGPLLEVPGLSYGGKVRSGPGTEYRQVGSLAEGDRIKIIRNSGVAFNGYDWFEVQVGDLVGFQWGGIMCSVQPVTGVFQQCADMPPNAPNAPPTAGGGGGGGSGGGWMAFASDERGTLGHGKGASRGQAEQHAMTFCGNSNCRVIDVTQNSCHAFVDSSQGGYWYGYASGSDPQVAQETAHINCAGFAAAPATCEMRYSICQ